MSRKFDLNFFKKIHNLTNYCNRLIIAFNNNYIFFKKYKICYMQSNKINLIRANNRRG